ncbi:MAG: TolC family protein [Paludibacteraceae bacterium]|nr:TolC family protein [Paludibacteraceae bacterium]
MKKTIILLAAVGLCSACCIYKKYEPKQDVPDNLLGQNSYVQQADTVSNLGQLPWTSLFSDVRLQNLVKRVLQQNADMKTAHLEVEKMQASLLAAKLAYVPSVQLNPTYNYQWWDKPSTSLHSYNVGIGGSWQLDIFGQLTTAKRRTAALVEQAKDFEQATQAELIASTVYAYYQLTLLDQQRDILHQTDSIWQVGLKMQSALMEAGKSYSTAVDQMRASIYNIHLQQLDIQRAIEQTEHSICLLLHETPHSIERCKLIDFQIPEVVGIGVPAALLHNRPDVRAAERSVEAAFYGTRGAYAAIFPNITISGNFGLTDFDPVGMAASVVASFLQPIFAQGKLHANLKIAKADQEEARLAFEKKVLQAGVEVNEALMDCQISKQKVSLFNNQIQSLLSATDGTHSLMEQGKATYLEVITAQEALLNAQLQQASNYFETINSVLNLYIALGGK